MLSGWTNTSGRWVLELRQHSSDSGKVERSLDSASNITHLSITNELLRRKAMPKNYHTKIGTRLKVPYKQKDIAKSLGAKWNEYGRYWYAPEGSDLSKFKRWLPKVQTPPAPIITSKPIAPPSLTALQAPAQVRHQSQSTARSSEASHSYVWLIAIGVLFFILFVSSNRTSKTQSPPTLAELRATELISQGYSVSPTGVKVGAICVDGWRSSSVGPGTCSQHGGVIKYLYAPYPDQRR